MHIAKATVTSKFQATIPKAIRNILHIKEHDVVIYQVTDDHKVLLRKASPFDLDYLKALQYTLTEWESEDDEKAYKNL